MFQNVVSGTEDSAAIGDENSNGIIEHFICCFLAVESTFVRLEFGSMTRHFQVAVPILLRWNFFLQSFPQIMAWVEKWWKDTAKKGLIWKADWGALRRSIEREGGVEKLMKRCHVLAVKAGHGLMIMLKVKVSIVRNYLHRSVLNLNTFRRY